MSEPLAGPISNLGEAAADLKAAAATFERTVASLPDILIQLERISVNLKAVAADARYIVDRFKGGNYHADPGGTAVYGD